MTGNTSIKQLTQIHKLNLNFGEITMNTTTLELNANSTWFDIPEDLQNQAWAESASFSSDSNRQRAYINFLAQKIIIPYLQEEVTSAIIEPNQTTFWELGVNGSLIQIDDKQRIIIIPTETFALEELRVPQEWVDIPALAGDYYLAVQVDTEENFLRIWGYTNHKKLKEKGDYNKRNRSYSLDREDLTEELNALWLTREYCPDEVTQSEIEPLPTLANDQLMELLDTLANQDLIFPRRAVSFQEWGAIFANETWREMLVKRRQPQTSIAPNQLKDSVVNLSQWLTNTFTEGWQTIEQVFAPQLATTFRNNRRFRDENKITRVKDLGLELNGNNLALIITVSEIETKMSIQAQINPLGEQKILPPNLRLIIADDQDNIFKEVVSRGNDKFIRYQFSGTSCDRFKIKVALEQASITEEFEI